MRVRWDKQIEKERKGWKEIEKEVGIYQERRKF